MGGLLRRNCKLTRSHFQELIIDKNVAMTAETTTKLHFPFHEDWAAGLPTPAEGWEAGTGRVLMLEKKNALFILCAKSLYIQMGCGKKNREKSFQDKN